MTDEMKIARRVQKNLRRIGVASTIEVKGDMTLVSGSTLQRIIARASDSHRARGLPGPAKETPFR